MAHNIQMLISTLIFMNLNANNKAPCGYSEII